MNYYTNTQHQLQTQSSETGIRSVRIRGVAVSISNQRGGLLIWGKPEHKGKSVTIEGRYGEGAYGHTANQSFIEFTGNDRRQYVAIFQRLTPGSYTVKSYISGHSYESVTISSEYASQLDWS